MITKRKKLLLRRQYNCRYKIDGVVHACRPGKNFHGKGRGSWACGPNDSILTEVEARCRKLITNTKADSEVDALTPVDCIVCLVR